MIRKGTMTVITNRIGLVHGELKPLKHKGRSNKHQGGNPAEGFSLLFPIFLGSPLRCIAGHREPIIYGLIMVLAWLWLRCHSGGESLVGGCWWLLRFRIEIGHVATSEMARTKSITMHLSTKEERACGARLQVPRSIVQELKQAKR